MEKEKYVVIKRTYSVRGGKPCKENNVNYLYSKNAYGIEVWKPIIDWAVRIPVEYPKYFGFLNNVNGYIDSMEYGASEWFQEIIEVEYDKTKHRLII